MSDNLKEIFDICQIKISECLDEFAKIKDEVVKLGLIADSTNLTVCSQLDLLYKLIESHTDIPRIVDETVKTKHDFNKICGTEHFKLDSASYFKEMKQEFSYEKVVITHIVIECLNKIYLYKKNITIEYSDVIRYMTNICMLQKYRNEHLKKESL